MNVTWRLNEKEGPTAYDELGTRDFTYSGTPLYAVDGLISNDSNTAVDFNGVGYAAGASLGTLTLPVTIEAWIYLSEEPTLAKPIFNTHDVADFYYGFSLQLVDDGRIYFQNGDGQFPGSQNRNSWWSVGTVPVGVPTHIVAVCTGLTTAAIYINGVLQSTTTSGTGSTINYGAGIPNIGHYTATSTESADFIIDEVALYDAVELTAAQVLTHYNAGRGVLL